MKTGCSPHHSWNCPLSCSNSPPSNRIINTGIIRNWMLMRKCVWYATVRKFHHTKRVLRLVYKQDNSPSTSSDTLPSPSARSPRHHSSTLWQEKIKANYEQGEWQAMAGETTHSHYLRDWAMRHSDE